MEKKRATEENESGFAPPSRSVDKFGFIKQDNWGNSAEGLTRSRSTNDRERYRLYRTNLLILFTGFV